MADYSTPFSFGPNTAEKRRVVGESRRLECEGRGDVGIIDSPTPPAIHPPPLDIPPTPLNTPSDLPLVLSPLPPVSVSEQD